MHTTTRRRDSLGLDLIRLMPLRVTRVTRLTTPLFYAHVSTSLFDRSPGVTINRSASSDRVPSSSLGISWLCIMADSPPPPPTQGVFQRYGAWVWNRALGKLWPHQLAAITNTMEHLRGRVEAKKRRVAVIVMPTGTGKTGIIATMPYALQSNKVLIVTPRSTLRGQVDEAIALRHGQENPPFLFARQIVSTDRPDMLPEVQVLESKSHEGRGVLFRPIPHLHVVLANAQMFYVKPDVADWRDLLPVNTFDLILIDEAHFHPAETWKRIIDHFAPSNIIFLTATPFRTNGEPVCAEDEFAFQLLRSQAVERKIIRDCVPHPIDFDAAEQKEYDSLNGNAPDVSLNRYLVCLKALMRRIMAELDRREIEQPLPDFAHRALVVVEKPSTNANALELLCSTDAALQGLRAAAFHSGKAEHTRANLLRLFGSSKAANIQNAPRVLIVVEMLREGYDNASISIVGIGRQLSAVGPAFEQFVGRAVRRSAGEPDGLNAGIFWHRAHDCQQLYNQYKDDRVIAVGDMGEEDEQDEKKVV